MSHKPKFPFRIITTWIHPSEVAICESCKQSGNIYAIDNYIPMVMLIGKTAYAKLSNDPWITAIKAQAREQFDVTFTSHLCVSCLNQLHINQFGDSQTWQQARDLLIHQYGESAIAQFVAVNSYEDEGHSYWLLCDVTETVLEVADFVEQAPIEPHETRETTREDRQGVLRAAEQFAQQRGQSIKIIRQDGEDNMTGFTRVLKTLLGTTVSFPLFLIQTPQKVFTVVFPKEKMKEGPSVAFHLGRDFAKSHPQVDPGQTTTLQVTPGQILDDKTEKVVVSLFDKKTSKIEGIPFKVIRDAQGNLVDLIDEGGLVEIAGTFLPAFLVGMRTARFPEKQALVMFDQEMQHLVVQLKTEMKRRGLDTTGLL